MEVGNQQTKRIREEDDDESMLSAEGSAHGERGRGEGTRGRKKLRVFWSIKYKKHNEEVRSGMFRRIVKL